MSNKNVVDVLLGYENGKFERPTKEVEITRLSKVVGEKVVFKCQALTVEQQEIITENAMQLKGTEFDISVSEMHMFTVIEGVANPSFKNKELMKKYGAVTPKDLVSKLLLSGEVSKLYNTISELSGNTEGAVEEVKN